MSLEVYVLEKFTHLKKKENNNNQSHFIVITMTRFHNI